MSIYTTQVRNICETQCGLMEHAGYDNVENILEQCWDKVIPDYPIFDENYRKVLNKKILLHYYTREIGTETVGLWKLRLKTKMGEIMPYYNQMYKSELLEFNPLYDVDLTTEHKGKGGEERSGSEIVNGNESSKLGGTDTRNVKFDRTQNRTTNNTRNDSGWDVFDDTNDGTTNDNGITHTQFADTPQGKVLSEDLAQNNYMTTDTVTKNENDQTRHSEDNHQGSHQNTVTDRGSEDVTINDTTADSTLYGKTDTRTKLDNVTSNGTVNTFDEYIDTVKGKHGGVTYSAMLKEFRETFLNIDMLVIRELEPLFMQIWGDVI